MGDENAPLVLGFLMEVSYNRFLINQSSFRGIGGWPIHSAVLRGMLSRVIIGAWFRDLKERWCPSNSQRTESTFCVAFIIGALTC